jgi:hypothetical protein
MSDAAYVLEALRKCLGYVENGTATSVTISQDDATKTYCVYVGKNKYHGDTLTEALVIAGAAESQQF